MSDKPERIGISLMEQLIEFPIGTIVGHSSFNNYAIFKVIGWSHNSLEAVQLRADDDYILYSPDFTDPYYFTQIDCITIIGEAAHEF